MITDELHMPRRGKTHRAGKGRNRPPQGPATDPHAAVKAHIQAADAATDPKVAHAHLFKAISALKKCK